MEEFLLKSHLGHLMHTFQEQNIDDVSLLPLLSEEHIKCLIPAIGDQIKFKKAVHDDVKSNDDCQVDQTYKETEPLSERASERGTKRTILEDISNTEEDIQPHQKLQKILNDPSLLFVVDTQQAGTSATSASTVTDLQNSDCGLNSSFLSVCNSVDNFSIVAILQEDLIGRAIIEKKKQESSDYKPR